MLRVALLSTHPIQYQVPWFRALTVEDGLGVTVLYAHLPTPEQQGDGFGVAFEWDVPLLVGYRHQRLENVARRPSLSTFSGCDTPGVGRVLREIAAQVLIINGWHVKTYLQALLAGRRLGLPCIARGDSNALKPRPPWIKLFHRLLLRQYAGFLVVGRANRNFYVGNGVPESRLFPGPHCVDNDFFTRGAAAAAARRPGLRESWGIPQDAFAVLFAGKLVEKKHPLDLVRAAARARAEGGSDLHLLFAGDGPLRDACRALMEELGQPGSILGFVNQASMPEVYAAADALVLPSDYGETWGLVVNEAMACGLPAIVSDRVGCHPDLVREGETGAIFPFGRVDELAGLLGSWTRERGRVRERGCHAQRLVRSYSVAALVRGTRAALERLTT